MINIIMLMVPNWIDDMETLQKKLLAHHPFELEFKVHKVRS